MNKKIIVIIILAILIVAGYMMTNEESNIHVHAEQINNTQEAYIVCELKDNNDNLIDTDSGRITLELLDKNGSGVVYENIEVSHGRAILREYNDIYMINAEYDGGIFYYPSTTSGNLDILNSTLLSDDNLTNYAS